MNRLLPTLLCGIIALTLAACGSSPKKTGLKTRSSKSSYTLPKLQPVRITHIDAASGGQELMLHSMSLIGTPYRYGGNDLSTGFDCSGMVRYVYQNALHVQLPRTARDIAAVSQSIQPSQLKVGDLVFFNTSGNPYSHMGLYIGNGEFIHAPSTNGTIRTAKLSSPYFAQRFTDARTLFAR